MRRALSWMLTGLACFLSPVGLMCLVDHGIQKALAEEHGHVWTEPSCEAEQCVGRCCSKKCVKQCVICGVPRVWSETKCSGGHGATGEYATAPASIWGPRPGGTGSDACPPHDWGEEKCGPWHQIKQGCKIRHCTHRCNKCGTNGKDSMEESPDGCMD